MAIDYCYVPTDSEWDSPSALPEVCDTPRMSPINIDEWIVSLDAKWLPYPGKASAAPSEEEDFLLERSLAEAANVVADQFDENEPTILPEALERSAEFLRAQSRETKSRFGFFPPAPTISPGPDGSADLSWEQPSWGLLVNVPSDGEATFYGECAGKGRIKGSLDPKSWNLGVITWLSRM